MINFYFGYFAGVLCCFIGLLTAYLIKKIF